MVDALKTKEQHFKSIDEVLKLEEKPTRKQKNENNNKK